MPITLDAARRRYARALSLLRRGLSSLRQRGWKETWRVTLRILAPKRLAPRVRADLYLPPEIGFSPFAVPYSATPRASIVIPVYGQVAHTLACLRALAAYPPQAPIEIVVVDDGSSDETPAWMPQIEGLHYHRRTENGGFIAACNDGAARARGDYLAFLNNDTVPQPGWLDALLTTFDTHADAGLVGAQLLYPDGRLQEAGGVVFADGSAWNYGRFESPYDPRFGYLRDADYCSGAAIVIPRALFAQLGGFDSRYAPAYYEDTDLAFAVRAAGRRVLYQPGACVVHKEGITAGTDTGSGTKAYQVRNRAVFAEKWQHALSAQLPAGSLPIPALLHRAQRQVLLVDVTTPRPDFDSASLRLVNLMHLLQEEGAHVCFIAADAAYDDRYSRDLQRRGVETWYAPDAASVAALLRQQGSRFDVVMLSRHHVAGELLDTVARHAPQALRVFDSVDLHGLREQRAAEHSGDGVLVRQAQATRAAELAVIARADVTLVVSPFERDWLAREAPQAQVEVISNLHEVAGAGKSFAERRDLVFVGGFRHPPNTDAVRWFVEVIFPQVRAQLPQVQLHCIGSDPPPAITQLAQSPGVHIHGHVPDLAPHMEGARIALAPLRFGAGVKGKINLSMAHGQPVVATPVAAEGMHLQDGVDVCVADTPERFAEAIVRLYQDETLWTQLSRNGLDNVRRHFSAEAARAAVRRVFFS